MRVHAAVLLGFFLSATTVSASEDAIKLSDGDRQAVVNEVIEHFRNHPEELVDAILRWREGNREAEQKTASVEGLPDPVTGRRDARVSLFAFSDYGCAPCISQMKMMEAHVAENPDIRIIHKDAPRSSIDAAAASIEMIAAAAMGGDWEAMRRIYVAEGVAPETRIKALAVSGVEVSREERVKAQQTMKNNAALAKRAGVTDLPAIIVVAGKKMKALSGAVTEAELSSAIKEVTTAAGKGP